MLQSKLGFIGVDNSAAPNRYEDNIITKIFGELDKASKWVENAFNKNLPPIFRKRQLTHSNERKLIVGASDLPRNFDARKQWPGCVGPMRDQLYCGACWAFASSGMLSDRFCIHSKGHINVTLSPQDLVACDFENFGCNGGLLVNTVDFLQTEGVASEECMPYQDVDTSCQFKCINPTKEYTKYYCRSGSLKILSDYEDIQRELYTNGPMMVGLSVYEDFTSYKNGTYKHVAGEMVGGHAIKLIGWGHDEKDGSLFWVCQNQWSEKWGMNGFINVKAGEIGLDSMAVACDPDIT